MIKIISQCTVFFFKKQYILFYNDCVFPWKEITQFSPPTFDAVSC